MWEGDDPLAQCRGSLPSGRGTLLPSGGQLGLELGIGHPLPETPFFEVGYTLRMDDQLKWSESTEATP